MASTDPPGEDRLNINYQHQEQDKWCWAAVVSMCAQFFSPSHFPAQCKVASDLLGMLCCASPDDCNQLQDKDQIVSAFGNEGMAAATTPVSKDEPPDPKAIREAIGIDHKPVCLIYNKPGGAHIFVVKGYDYRAPPNFVLRICDPAAASKHEQDVAYKDLQRTFGDPSWMLVVSKS